MMMISNKTSSMVKPAQKTWSGKLPLSKLDQCQFPHDHVSICYFYTCPSPDHEWTTILQTLKSSLSYTLVHFYPLVGRLSAVARGRLDLDCNAVGVLFVEAYADKKLTDLDTSLPSSIYHQLIPSIFYNNNTPLEDIPLLVLQVTRFVCGGFCLGLDISHVVADGQSTFHIVSEWARISRGELLESPPYLDRKVLRAGDPPKRENSRRFEPNPPPPLLMAKEPEHEKETTVRMLKLTASQVEKLRKKANNSWKSGMAHGFTRYEVVTAHIWRTACKVRKHKPEQPTRLAIPINIRSKMRPPLP